MTVAPQAFPHRPGRSVARLACLGVSLLSLACTGGGESLAEALAKADEKQAELPADYKPNPKPRPKGLEGPTEEEFAAWNRTDPEGEKHLYKWDKAHLDEMLGYWEDLQCFREEVKGAGQKAFGAEPGSAQDEQWFQFKKGFVVHLDSWQKRLFSEQPRIKEKSKFLGNFLEAHEMIMNNYPVAYNESDEKAVKKADLHWTVVEAKMKKYTKSLGGEWTLDVDPADAKSVERHAEHCKEAMTPPDRSGKVKKRRRRKGAI